MKKKISAKIIADSVDGRGNRITTYILTYPRIIHGELMTHRMFSRNAASSRAIPFAKMIREIEEDPFTPIAWQKDHKGMQGNEYLDGAELKRANMIWLQARDSAVNKAKMLNHEGFAGVTKQLCNRLLEPFQWMTTLVTATEYDNFFELRCPSYGGFAKNGKEASFKSKNDVRKHFKSFGGDTTIVDGQCFISWQSINTSQAEIHIQALAEVMWDAKNESTPNQLESGEWHMPFMDNFDPKKLLELSGQEPEDFELICRKIATARAARISYTTHDGKIDYAKDIALHDTLLEQKHASAFEHCARMMDDFEYSRNMSGELELSNPDLETYTAGGNTEGWCRNFRGFIPYRHIVNL